MARRTAYTRVERENFFNPSHVKGMGDRTFRGFQCLNKDCENFVFVQSEDIDPDFEITCPSCNFVHKAGESSVVYNYRLIKKNNDSLIEEGSFDILHDQYLLESKEFKYCIVCGALKPFDLFDLHKSRKTRRQGECRLCKKMYNSIKNQTRLAEQHREASQKRRLYTHFEDPAKISLADIYARFESRCFKCGLDVSADITGNVSQQIGNLDHTLPVFYLWPLTTDNATLLCKAHNSEKAQKWPRAYYDDNQLRRLSVLTGIDYQILSGDPCFNPAALEKLQEAAFVDALFEKFARYPEEVLKLRNRVLQKQNFDFFDASDSISDAWRARADELMI